ncbi:hypothetical protein ZWY2020_050727 [Hordeum vulgare]|nr:hypothetical protein ZWY2020_050727 [Hordeum vulgare]
MGPVIRKLGELLVRECNLKKRVKKGVQALLTELEIMHAVLRKVGEVPSDQLEEPVRIWAGKVRDLSCDMEDAVDDFLVRVDDGSSSKPADMRSRVKKFLKKTTTLFGKGKALHQICDAIEEAQDLANQESSSGISLKYVGNLIHLRYLGLRKADVQELPMGIGKLQLLQTLDIRGTGIEELPASVVQLTNLICLSVDVYLVMPKGMGKLTSLEVLDGVGLSPQIVKELGHLTELRTFSITCVKMDEGQIDILIMSLGNLHKLHNLRIGFGGRLIDRMRESWVPPPHLRSFVSWDFIETAWFSILPKWVNSRSLPHLSTLSIGVKELQGDDLQIIGMLPALRFLQLSARHVMGTLVVRADAFPYARCCKFYGFLTSPGLFPPGAMPGVQRLEFRVSVPSITSCEVDCGMGHLPSLEHVQVDLSLENSSDEEKETAKTLLRRAAEAHPKHPTIKIYEC